MKRLMLAAALSSIAALPVHAADATGTFDVVINLTSKCEINSTAAATGAVIGDLTLDYTSFQASAATGSTNFNVRCTTGLPFSLSLDSASLTDGTTGLAYTLALSDSAVYAAGPTATLGSQTGTGANATYYVHGTIAAGLGGSSTAGAANKTRTLTVTY